jgi:hypothetical protein
MKDNDMRHVHAEGAGTGAGGNNRGSAAEAAAVQRGYGGRQGD